MRQTTAAALGAWLCLTGSTAAAPADSGGLGKPPATASVSCPDRDRTGHELKHGETGTLYFGDPSKRGAQAPDTDAGGSTTYNLPKGGAGYVLECLYSGTTATVRLEVPKSARSCKQTEGSFTCR